MFPTRHVFDDITGPFCDTPALEDWFGISRQAIHKRVKARTSLGALPPTVSPSTGPGSSRTTARRSPTSATCWTPWLPASVDPWDRALWLSAPAPYLGDTATTAARWLADGNAPAPVLVAARGDAQRTEPVRPGNSSAISFVALRVITRTLVDGAVVSALRSPTGRRLADTISPLAADYVTREIGTSTPYALPQQWAQALHAAGHGGIRYQPRFSHRALVVGWMRPSPFAYASP